MKDVVAQCSYPGMRLSTRSDKLLLETTVKNSRIPGDVSLSLVFPTPQEATELQLVRWVLDCILEFVTHEASEWFAYKGERVFDPHDGHPYDPYKTVVPLREM